MPLFGRRKSEEERLREAMLASGNVESLLADRPPSARPRGIGDWLSGALAMGAGDDAEVQRIRNQRLLAGLDPAIAALGKGLEGSRGPIGPGVDGEPLPGRTPPRFAPEERIMSLRVQLARAQMQGADTRGLEALLSNYEDQARRSGYLETVPEADRPMARINVPEFAKWDRETRVPQVFDTGGGLATVNRRTGDMKFTPDPPRRPDPSFGWEYGEDGLPRFQRNGPADPEYIRRKALADAEGGRAGAPPEWLANPDGPTLKAPTQSGVMGGVMAKVARGEPLTPGEQKLWDRYEQGTRGGGADFGMSYGDGYDDEPFKAPGPRAPAPPTNPIAPPRPAGPPPNAPRKNPISPSAAPPMSALKEGQVTEFRNGQAWTVRGGKPVRVR